ncbi:hypothetical protein VDGE_00983 [Verticillium dahliae]|uniref:SET domain-containing protein n=1 Tax=Verticillium dahliae TaxID=27337 RepID=A0A444S9Q1_VERDA|nr:hypothetical protein VDGE_00983 [Verticillium dahliae]
MTTPSFDRQFHNGGGVSLQHTPTEVGWTTGKIARALEERTQDLERFNQDLVAFTIKSVEPTEKRVLKGTDWFSCVKHDPVPVEVGNNDMIKIKVKHHGRSKKEQRTFHFMPICIKTERLRVPKYRFHHKEIARNVLTPNTMLKFVPHIRDLEANEERNYNLWLKELERMDASCGFQPMGTREQRVIRTAKKERTAMLALYLDYWLGKLAIPDCTRTTLIRHMASNQSDMAITPLQKSSLYGLHRGNGPADTPQAALSAKMFTEAFNQVFHDGVAPERARGHCKAVTPGKSQLDGCGYGLFTLEDIAQHEFVIEYTGELIMHDEGVRREARRGEVFDEGSFTSYVFSLLDSEGIWVDAAIYGNHSRYINHEQDTYNVEPKILYVNGEYRIRFSATRNIQAGEELFFNYGNNFPNLTKKMIKDKTAEEDGPVTSESLSVEPLPAKKTRVQGGSTRGRGRGGTRGRGRGRGVGRGRGGGRGQATKSEPKPVKRGRLSARKEAPQMPEEGMQAASDLAIPTEGRKRKRDLIEDSEEEEEEEEEDYEPTTVDEESDNKTDTQVAEAEKEPDNDNRRQRLQAG